MVNVEPGDTRMEITIASASWWQDPQGTVLSSCSLDPQLRAVLLPSFSRAQSPSPPLDSVGCHKAHEEIPLLLKIVKFRSLQGKRPNGHFPEFWVEAPIRR